MGAAAGAFGAAVGRGVLVGPVGVPEGAASFEYLVELEVERLLGRLVAELHLQRSAQWERNVGGGDLRLHRRVVLPDGERRGRHFLVPGVTDDNRAGEALARDRQRLGEVVVEEHAEETGLRVGAFDVMPRIGRHEELSAVSRIVIAVRAEFVADLSGRTISALAGLEALLVRGVGAGPEL